MLPESISSRTNVHFFVLVFLLTSVVSAQESDKRIIGEKFDLMSDGRCYEYLLVQNLRTGKIAAVKREEALRLVRNVSIPIAGKNEGILPLVFRRFPHGMDSLDFCLNTHADQYRSKISWVLDDYINALRGTNNKPEITLTEEIIETEGNSFEDYLDGKNSIYTLPDDRVFWDEAKGRVAGYSVRRYDFDTGVLQECDVALTFNCFRDYFSNYFLFMLGHELGHVFGYRHSSWIDDYMCYTCPSWEIELFHNPDGMFWNTGRLKDMLYYGGKIKKGIYRAIPKLMPLNGSLVDLQFLKTDLESDPIIWGHVLAATTLKGYKKKPLTLAVYRGDKIDESKLILTTTGFNRDIYKYKGYYGRYEVTDIMFRKPEEYDKLEQALRTYGTQMTVYGTDYTYSLLGTIAVTGYYNPDSRKPKTLKSTVTFILMK
jgi:hypothetical protein